jgi:hypothetical protein
VRHRVWPTLVAALTGTGRTPVSGRSEAVWLDVGKPARMTGRNLYVPLLQSRVQTRVAARITSAATCPPDTRSRDRAMCEGSS